jgi:hypothetical protein
MRCYRGGAKGSCHGPIAMWPHVSSVERRSQGSGHGPEAMWQHESSCLSGGKAKGVATGPEPRGSKGAHLCRKVEP